MNHASVSSSAFPPGSPETEPLPFEDAVFDKVTLGGLHAEECRGVLKLSSHGVLAETLPRNRSRWTLSTAMSQTQNTLIGPLLGERPRLCHSEKQPNDYV